MLGRLRGRGNNEGEEFLRKEEENCSLRSDFEFFPRRSAKIL